MATALQESKSLQERINSLQIKLNAANEEQRKTKLGVNFIDDEDEAFTSRKNKLPSKNGLLLDPPKGKGPIRCPMYVRPYVRMYVCMYVCMYVTAAQP